MKEQRASGDVAEAQGQADLVRVILDAVPGGVVHVAADGSIVAANPEALRILGFRFDDLTQRFISDFDPETIWEDGSPCPVADYPVAKVLTTGEAQGPVTIGVRRRDGTTSWAVFRAVPTLGGNGELTGAVVAFLDITERKRAEEELRRSEAKWRSLAENLPDFVVTANREARIQSINRVLPEYEASNVIGTFAHAYMHVDYVEDWSLHFQRAIDTQAVVRTEGRGAGPGGETAWYEQSFVPIVESSGQVERVLIVARDITDQRSVIAKLAARERLASVGMLAASVAHEIMNPLTYVLANLDLALSERCPPGERRTKALRDAREGAARMQQIVQDLRSLGREGAEELFYVDIRAVIETALRLCGPEVAKHITIHLGGEEVPGVMASESRLCQVFINLVMNATQAMTERAAEERAIHIRTRTDDVAGLVGVDISDTGLGIAPENLTRIFDAFYTTKQTGTGLGLSISKESIERMGGRIAVTSELGRGTTFTVWLSTTRVPKTGA